MASTVTAAFTEFASRLELTANQRSDAQTKHVGVKDCLETKYDVSTAFLQGSYARSTMIRPPCDLDLFVVFAGSHFGASPSAILQQVHDCLKATYVNTPIRKDRPAVNLDFATIGFDVVPAFAYGQNYVIPSPFADLWITTNPKRHQDITAAINEATGGSFVPLVKMFKQWNRCNYSRLTGFHLEVALGLAWPRESTLLTAPRYGTFPSAADASAVLLERLADQLAYQVDDPAGLSGRIDTYLTADDRKRARACLLDDAAEAQIALRHQARGNHASAINKWRAIFGDEFPAFS